VTRKLLVLLIVVLALAGVVVAAAVNFARVEDRTVTTRPVPIRVEIDLEAGGVEVRAAPANEARADLTRRYLLGAPEIRETFVDGVLRVEAECRTFVRVGCEVVYRLDLPATVPVSIRTERGSVDVAGMTGIVEVDTDAGAVRLSRTRGPLRVTTSAGDIEGEDLVAGFLDATTKAGRIRLSMAEPSSRVGLQTSAGSIDLALPRAEGGYRVMTETGAGEVDVSVVNDPGALRAVTARTGAGNITIHDR
jgi:hypothetical protein